MGETDFEDYPEVKWDRCYTVVRVFLAQSASRVDQGTRYIFQIRVREGLK